MFDNSMTVQGFDDEIFSAIQEEERRQEEHIELIASENYTSPRVMQVQGTVLTNKYAEGYPHKRYYGGCEFVDKAEELAIERVKALFGAAYANVQPHSGSQANSAVFLALLLGLAMSLAEPSASIGAPAGTIAATAAAPNSREKHPAARRRRKLHTRRW